MNCLKRTMWPKWMLTVVDVGNSMLPGILWTNTRYRRRNLTRNVVDVQIIIPDCNLFISYHFCYKYFRTSKGSPYTLLPDMLKPIMIRLYDKYFVDMTLTNVSTRVHFTGAYCDHNEDDGPEKKHTQMIPKWYMKELYSTTQHVSTFSLFWTVNVLFEAEISCCWVA